MALVVVGWAGSFNCTEGLSPQLGSACQFSRDKHNILFLCPELEFQAAGSQRDSRLPAQTLLRDQHVLGFSEDRRQFSTFGQSAVAQG